MDAYRNTFLYKHLEVVAESSESMLIRQSARNTLAEMDETDTANGNPKVTEGAPSDESATVH